MALSMYRTNSATVNVAQVVGALSNDGSTVTYTDENGDKQTITISDFLNTFKGKDVEITVFEHVDNS